MNAQTPQEIKYAFSCDLIIYLTSIILSNIPKEDHEPVIQKIMNNWSQRIEIARTEILKQFAPQVAAEQNMELDVATIMVDAHNIESKMLKGEFKKEARELIIKTLIPKKEGPIVQRLPVRKKIMGQ